MDKSELVIVGANIFGESLLKALIGKWKIICIDYNEELVNKLKDRYKEDDVEFVVGDTSSLLTWKKIKKIEEIKNIKSIVITIRDADIALETCRIAREVLNFESDIFVLLFNEEKEEEFNRYNVQILKPTDLITKILLSRIEKNYSIAINVGLGQGELIEISVLARSHLVDRKLKYLRATRWRIAAIYREGKLIIPSGEEKIKVGDKIIIVGDPKVLHNLVEILTRGVPQFPQQFGTNVAVLYRENLKYGLEEAVYLKRNTKAHKVLVFPYESKVNKKELEKLTDKYEIQKSLKEEIEIFEQEKDIGLVVFPIRRSILPFWTCKLRKVFKKAKKPFLIPSGNIPYKKIVVSLNSPDPAFILSIAIELSRLLKIPYEVIYVNLPKELRGFKEEEALKEREEVIKDYEHIYKTSIKYIYLEGNPVKETVRYICSDKEKSTLFLTAYDKKQKISFFEPHVPFLTVKKIKTSSLLIPLQSEEVYG